MTRVEAYVGVPVTVEVTDGDIGLVGHITCEVYDPLTSVVVLGPTADGISEPRPGSYVVTVTLPVAGRFRVRWAYEAAGVAVSAEEDLVAWPSAPAGARGGEIRHVLVHFATPVRYEEGLDAETWVEGEPGAEGPVPMRGVPFPCVLFLPLGQEETPGGDSPRGRKITRPTILFEPVRPSDWPEAGGSPIVVGADDELLVFAPELAGHFAQAANEAVGTGRWQVDGRPQPFGPPGTVIGVQATLKQVSD